MVTMTSSTDRTTAYALAVTGGEILAGPHVRDACQRHLDDLKTGAARGLRFDAEAADRAFRFFRKILRVQAGSDFVPFELLDWQAFIVGSLFGWSCADGTRRFSEAFVETGKGSGKSPLAAGIGLYMMIADGEMAAEVYAAATKKDQAMVLFRDAVAMVETSPQLSRRITKSGVEPVWKLSYPKKRAFFKPLAKGDGGESGPRPHAGLIDEIHEHRNGDTIAMVKAGFKGRRQPLLFQITNSGSDLETVCYELHAHGALVAAQDLEDDKFFAYICALDEDDDPLNDEACWPKANPSIGHTIALDYLRGQVADAKALPSRENGVLRLNFCRWTEAPNTWIGRDVWRTREHDLALDDYLGRRVWLGLDLSYGDDLTALALVFDRELPDGEIGYDLFVEFWKPKGVIAEHEKEHRAHYGKWAERGFLQTPPGPRLKLRPIADRLAEIAEDFDVQVLAYDRYRVKDLEADLQSLGIELAMTEHPQGFRRAKDTDLWMPESVLEFENAAVEGRLRTPAHPILRWNVMSATVREDPAGTGNKHLDKRKSTGKIDGAVAAVMAVGAAKNLLDEHSGTGRVTQGYVNV